DFVNNAYLQEKVTVYTTLPNGDVRLGSALEHRFSQPDASAQPYLPDNSANSTIYKTIQTYTYDASSNLVGIKDEANRPVTNIYDYLDKYTVATVINADPLLDKSAYSSFESVGFGGWQLAGSGPAYASSGITGTRSFILNGNTLTANSLNTTRAYTLSFWTN